MDATRNGDIRPGPRPRFSREYPPGARRERLMLLAADLAHELGPAAVTTAKICSTAGAATGTFYEHFSSAEDCLGQAAEEAQDRLLAPLGQAPGKQGWLTGTAAAIDGYFAAVAEEPHLAELVLTRSVPAGPNPPQPWQPAVVDALSDLFRPGRAQARELGSAEPPACAEEFLAHAALGAARLALSRGQAGELACESGAVAFLVGATYLGAGETIRILGTSGAPSANERRAR